MTPTIEPLAPGTHTTEDLMKILEADDVQPQIERIPLLKIHEALISGEMTMWRVHPGPAVFVTEYQSDIGCKRLCVIRGAGRYGITLRKVLKQLWKVAQQEGCECVQTVVYSERFKTALELCGAKTEGYIMTYTGD